MQPYEIVTRRITTYAGVLAEIPSDAPTYLRTWTCHAFFVPGAAEKDLKAKVTEQHIDITKVHGGCWIYGPRWKLERTLWACARFPIPFANGAHAGLCSPHGPAEYGRYLFPAASRSR